MYSEGFYFFSCSFKTVIRLTRPCILRKFNQILDISYCVTNSREEQSDFSLTQVVGLDFISITECSMARDFLYKGEQEETERRAHTSYVPVSEEVVNAAGFRGLLI